MYKHYNNLREIEYFGISTEHHQDGELHHHALIVYAKRFNLTTSRYFDWVNEAGESIHPNIEAARSLIKVFEYITKEGYEFSEWGERPIEAKLKIGNGNLYDAARKMDYEEFMTVCRAEKIQYGYVQDAMARKKFALSTIKPGDPIKGVVLPPLDTFTYDFATGSRSLVLVGDTGIGKTTWGKLHLPRPILLVRCLETLKAFDPGYHKSILFDDMTFSGWTRDLQVYLVDRNDPSGINVKHGSVILDTEAVRMFTNNVYPFTELPEIRRRVHRVDVDESNYTVYDVSGVLIPSDVPIVRSLRPEQLNLDIASLADPNPVPGSGFGISDIDPRSPKRRSSINSPSSSAVKRSKRPKK